MGKQLDRINDELAIGLGYEQGKPRYQWKHSNECWLAMRDKDNKRDYIADPATGLIQVKAVYVKRNICPTLTNQWVLCKWLDPGPEDSWTNTFGKFVEYPAQGYYAPTNVSLDPGIKPWDRSEEGQSLAQYIIQEFKRQEAKTYADHLREGEEIVARREADKDRQLEDMILDLRLPFGHVPGSKEGGVSLPTPGREAAYERAFGGEAPHQGEKND